MQIVQIDVTKPCAELRERIQRGFLRAPVEFRVPVFHEFAKIADFRPVGPSLAGSGIGKAGAREALAKIRNIRVGDMQREWDGLACHVHPSWRRCALRTYMALSASSSALLASA